MTDTSKTVAPEWAKQAIEDVYEVIECELRRPAMLLGMAEIVARYAGIAGLAEGMSGWKGPSFVGEAAPPAQRETQPTSGMCSVCMRTDVPFGTRDGKLIYHHHDRINGYTCTASLTFVQPEPAAAPRVEGQPARKTAKPVKPERQCGHEYEGRVCGRDPYEHTPVFGGLPHEWVPPRAVSAPVTSGEEVRKALVECLYAVTHSLSAALSGIARFGCGLNMRVSQEFINVAETDITRARAALKLAEEKK